MGACYMNVMVDISNVILETERLVIRPWSRNDLKDFYDYASVDGVGQMAGWNPHKSLAESKDILEQFIANKRIFALELKENKKVIGSIGLEEICVDLGEPYSNLKGREIGYVLSREYWGQGLMAEAVLRIMEYCFKNLNCDFLQCSHAIDNDQSRRVIEKVGFQYVKDYERTGINGIKHKSRVYIKLRPSNKNAIVILHEIYGINDFIQTQCQTYREAGYDVFCPNLIDRKPFSYEESMEAYDYFMKNVGFEVYSDINNYISSLRLQYDRVLIIGFSVGATIAWRCCENAHCSGIIACYGSRIRDFADLNPVCPTLLLFAKEDSFHVQELISQLCNKDKLSIKEFDAKHGFIDSYSNHYSIQQAEQAEQIKNQFIMRCIK